MKKNKSARRFQLTWNNPDKHGVTHEVIKETFFSRLKSTQFICMADERGIENQVFHTHCYCEFSNNSPKRFSTLKKAFPTAHIEQAFADSQANIDYIKKEGKWKDSEKADTVIEGSYEQYGTPSNSFRGQRHDLDELYLQIKQGATDYELLESNPKNMRLLNFISRTRSAIEAEKNAKSVRELNVIYVFGGTSTNRLEFIFDKYGIKNIFRFCGYQRAIFDGYNKEPILLLDNFKQGFPLTEMVSQLLSGFPYTLHCRYNDKQALYTTVIISSRNSPDSQYLDEDAADRQEFLDKLDTIIQLHADGTVSEYTNKQYFDLENRLPKDNPFK